MHCLGQDSLLPSLRLFESSLGSSSSLALFLPIITAAPSRRRIQSGMAPSDGSSSQCIHPPLFFCTRSGVMKGSVGTRGTSAKGSRS
eukprot:759588-Hanusia_phi.AAC.2